MTLLVSTQKWEEGLLINHLVGGAKLIIMECALSFQLSYLTQVQLFTFLLNANDLQYKHFSVDLHQLRPAHSSNCFTLTKLTLSSQFTHPLLMYELLHMYKHTFTLFQQHLLVTTYRQFSTYHSATTSSHLVMTFI